MGINDSGSVITVVAGGAWSMRSPRAPWSVAAHPAPGATARIEICATPTAILRDDPATARWVVLEGAITTSMVVSYPGPVTGIRLSSVSGETVFEVVQ